MRVLCHRQGAVRRLLDAALNCGSGQYKKATLQTRSQRYASDTLAVHIEIECPQVQETITAGSHVTASLNLVPERWGPAVAKPRGG